MQILNNTEDITLYEGMRNMAGDKKAHDRGYPVACNVVTIFRLSGYLNDHLLPVKRDTVKGVVLNSAQPLP